VYDKWKTSKLTKQLNFPCSKQDEEEEEISEDFFSFFRKKKETNVLGGQ
jgi:hypothetical protein